VSTEYLRVTDGSIDGQTSCDGIGPSPRYAYASHRRAVKTLLFLKIVIATTVQHIQFVAQEDTTNSHSQTTPCTDFFWRLRAK